MATNGSFNTNSYEVRYLTFSWSIDSQSIADNSTTISWQLKGEGGTPGRYYWTGNFKVVVDGETVFTQSEAIKLQQQVVASGKKTIYHNSDGKRSFTASASAGIYYTGSNNTTGSGSWDLTQIPRQANIVSAPNFNDEENPQITYSNPAGNAVTKLESCIANENGDILISYRAISKTGTSYRYNFTSSERSALWNYCKTSNSRNLRFYIRTEIGGKSYYSSVAKVIYIVNATPTLTPGTNDINQTTINITGDSGRFIRYQSTMKATCNASAKKGATIVSQKITNHGNTVNAGTATFYAVESGETTFEATDSRGNTVKKTISDVCYPYINDTVSIIDAKLNADGSLKVTFSGNLYDGSLGKQNNVHWAYIDYKEQNGNWHGWKSVSNQISLGSYSTYTVNTTITGLDYTKTYVIKCGIEDSIKFRQTPEKTVVSKPVYAWGKDRFIFNCPTISGQILSIGGIPSENFIQSGGDFNKYTQPGVYCVAQSAYMDKIINKPPSGHAGRLIVTSSLGDADQGGTWSYIKQEFKPYTNNGSWMRNGYTGTTPNKWTWNEWVLELNTNDVDDYVVAEGNSGVWRYRKWNSGKAECYGRSEYGFNKPAGSKYGNMYSYYLDVAYPFHFLEKPVSLVTIGVAGYACSNWARDVQDTAHIQLFTHSNYSTASSTGVFIMASGRWK